MKNAGEPQQVLPACSKHVCLLKCYLMLLLFTKLAYCSVISKSDRWVESSRLLVSDVSGAINVTWLWLVFCLRHSVTEVTEWGHGHNWSFAGPLSFSPDTVFGCAVNAPAGPGGSLPAGCQRHAPVAAFLWYVTVLCSFRICVFMKHPETINREMSLSNLWWVIYEDD